MAVLKWAWRHHVLGVERFDTIEEAAASAYYAAEYGEEAFECVEVTNASGSQTMGWSDLEPFIRPLREAEDAAYASAPPIAAMVRLRTPDGKHDAAYSTHASVEAAEAALADLRPLFGDRVSVERVKVASR